jgi:membrane protein DedA with SNARE-associated domain
VIATWAGSLPGSSLLVYLGYVARRGAEGGAAATDWLRWGFFLVTGIIAMAYLAGVARRQLAQRLPPRPR